MKNRTKVLSLLMCLFFCSTALYFGGTEEVSADPPEYYFEGQIIDDEENGLEGIYVDVTNLDTSETETVITDEDGYYEVDFDEVEWEPPFEVKVETTNAENYDYYDEIFYFGVLEDIPSYSIIQGLKGIVEEQTYYFSIYCGKFHLTEGSGYQTCTLQQSNEKKVQSDAQKGIQVGFDTYFDYLRTDTNSHYFTYYIETYDQYLTDTQTSSWNQGFTTPLNNWYTFSSQYYIWHGTLGKKQMISTNGINCYIDIPNDGNGWLPDGNGAKPHSYEANFVGA
jgi:hypothetical protein